MTQFCGYLMTCADTFQLQSFDVIETNKVNDTCESVCVFPMYPNDPVYKLDYF